jgi:hypothetical protein
MIVSSAVISFFVIKPRSEVTAGASGEVRIFDAGDPSGSV